MADNGDDSFVRLHITPLDPELIKTVIPALVLPVARNVSFHTIETFPEKRYGFVDLPREEAEKLKKRLHGVTFKGSKMRVEKARAEERIEPTNKLDGEEKEKKKLKKQKEKKEEKEEKEGEKTALDKSKKRKREVDVLDGVALKDRKVKRGWTEVPTEQKKRRKNKKDGDKDKKEEKKSKKRTQSKYTEGEECLLQLKMPPNAVKNVPAADLAAQKKKKKGSARQVTVHEFEKTTKFPSFLRQTAGGADSKRATEFVEGKGWVDEEGNVVEAVTEKPGRARGKTNLVKPTSQPEHEVDTSETSSDGTSFDESSSSSSEEEESDLEMEAASLPQKSQKAHESESDSATSSSSENESSDNSASTPNQKEVTPDSAKKAKVKNLVIQTVNPATPQAPRVHPLEALYKRPRPDSEETAHTPDPTKEAEPFSFFGGDAADLEDGDEAVDSVPAMPLTPYTRQDLEWRNIRSAAPTPDTTHTSRVQLHMWPLGTPSGNGRMQKWDEAEEEADEEEEEEEEEEEAEGPEGQEQASSSDFQKWFWENRRDLNKSWMGRRKTAAKEKRYRENKARASKAV